MAQEQKKMIELTDPGSIKPHSGHYFLRFEGKRKIYKVSEYPRKVETSLHSEEVVMFGKTLKTYFFKNVQTLKNVADFLIFGHGDLKIIVSRNEFLNIT